MKYQTALSVAAALTAANAHTIFVQLEAGGVLGGIGEGIRVPSYDGPINDVTTDDIVCNGGPNPTTPSDVVIDVTAGETVQAIWRHTLDSGPDDVLDSSHKGPVMAYLKKVDDATSDSGIGDGWFKISADGLSGGTWATDTLIANQGIQDIPIPECLEDGQYLLRAELIGLHAASASLGAQFYMECAQINVSGGSGGASPATVAFPGAYAQDDAGIQIDIYSSLTDYSIPGPDVFTC